MSTQTTALAALRPGHDKDKLIAAAGDRWIEPHPALAGKVLYLQEDFSFDARLDRDGKIGQVAFEYNFDETQIIEGLRMRMPEAEIARALPQLKLSEPTAIMGPYRHGHLTLPDGSALYVRVGHGRIVRITISNGKAVYPNRGPMPLPLPEHSFDVHIVPGLQPRGAPAPDGWCCGLPRGITPEQWPLSSRTGYPLEHHFTVRVPESYRTKGETFVALALFSDAGDEANRSPAVLALMNTVFDGRPLPEAVSADLQPFLDHLRKRHPMEFRSKDILHATFVAIWLTEAEFAGVECEPPMPIINTANRMCEPPEWVRTTTTQRLFGWDGNEAFDPERYWRHRAAGRPLADKWELLRLKITERNDDPNTGREPIDFVDAPEAGSDGYVPKYSETWTERGYSITYGDLHFGGTASPAQAMPDLTPFFIEFEESMGMINFGGGNGQLDLVTMMIDWAQ